MTKTASLIAVAMLLTCGAAQACEYCDWDDIVAPYRQRIDGMTSSSGNAQNVNTATHVITPWPRHVRDRRIPANGARMVGAIQRYQDGGKQRLPLMVKGDKSALEMPLEGPSTAGTSGSAQTTPAAGTGTGTGTGTSGAAGTGASSGGTGGGTPAGQSGQ